METQHSTIEHRSRLNDLWLELSPEERIEHFKNLNFIAAQDFFLKLDSEDQLEIIRSSSTPEKRLWLRLLDPDDVADVIQKATLEERQEFLGLLDQTNRVQVSALLAYAEDVAGGLMNPSYVRARPEMTAAQAIRYVREQALEHVQYIYYIYVISAEQKLIGVMSLRELFTSGPDEKIESLMHTDLVTVDEQTDQEAIGHLFSENDLIAIPVTDGDRHMKGIVTIDDIVDVVEEEATEDIQKIGGVEVLDAPYLRINLLQMIRKRAGWLTVLFFGESLTASAMGFYENQIAKAVVLALFIPLIISSGGNAGSQASTLVIRAMALGEIHLRDWWKVMRREIIGGIALGSILGTIGAIRVLTWQFLFHVYGPHTVLIALTIAFALVGVVMWGSVAGSLLPLILRRCGFDPASASSPFVATLVDVTGLVIYFSVASIILKGTML